MTEEYGTIYQILPAETGVSASGKEWARQTIVLEVYGSRNTVRRLALTTSFARQIEELKGLQVGDRVKVRYTVSAREFKGRWYTNVDLNYIDVADGKTSTADDDLPDTGEDELDKIFGK